jgi:hypothetical protein
LETKIKNCVVNEGDRNTKFFHACASQRKRTNTIAGLRDEIRTEYNQHQLILRGLLLSISMGFSHRPTHKTLKKLPEQLIVWLHHHEQHSVMPFMEAEVRTALFQMHPSKAPGPDGMSALFFQKYWHIIGHDVTTAILDFLKTGSMLGCVNFTYVVLIPKVPVPQSMTQFRPISLCNVLYKIASKMLVNRMKTMLHRLFQTVRVLLFLGG